MRIERVESWKETVPLSRPYTIARKTTRSVDLFFVRLVTDGVFVGLGSASPSEQVTGESAAACQAALDSGRVSDLVGRDPRCLGALCAWVEQELSATPAAAETTTTNNPSPNHAGIFIPHLTLAHHQRTWPSITLA